MTESGGGSQQEPEESVRQVKQTARQPWSWISQRKKVEEQILGWQTVMRSLLGGLRGRCWSDGAKNPAGDRQVRWPVLQGYHVDHMLCPNNNLTQSQSVSSDILCLFFQFSPFSIWSRNGEGRWKLLLFTQRRGLRSPWAGNEAEPRVKLHFGDAIFIPKGVILSGNIPQTYNKPTRCNQNLPRFILLHRHGVLNSDVYVAGARNNFELQVTSYNTYK